MNRTLLRASLLSLLLFAFTLVGRASDLDFKLVNATGYDIRQVFISPSKSNEWGSNVIKGGLKDGQYADITFHPDADAEKWDIKITWAAPYEKDPPVYWRGCKLSEITTITLKYNKSTDETSAVAE